jgi:glycosyltransferase involved in cell wall biosynthesis/Flp pilus assembly protein TadD
LSQEYDFLGESEFNKLLGVCFSETGRPAEALKHFRRYLELEGKEPEIIRRAGVCAVNVQDFESGFKYLEEAEKLGVARSEILLPLAFSCLQLKDFSRAKLLVQEAEGLSVCDGEALEKIKKMFQPESNGGERPGRPRSAGARISLCMIVRNEEERLPGCLESVRGLVDEIVVVDTGSSDKTQEIARAHGARVFSLPWSGDFAAARNESLRHASGDWILFLDADERLNTHGIMDCLRKGASTSGLDACVVPILNRHAEGQDNYTIGSAIRFFRNFDGIRFSGRVHENVERFLVEAGAKVGYSNFAIEHLGYALDTDTVREKYERNLRLLEEELSENPGDAYNRYHLGMTLIGLKREDEAREAFDLALRGNGLAAPLEAMACNMKSYLHLRAGELEPAFQAASRSLRLIPVQNTARLLKGLVFYYRGAYGEALPLLLESYRFISLPSQQRKSDIYFEDTIDKLTLIENIGTCFAEIGRFREAIPFLKLCARTRSNALLFERLGVSLLNTGNYSGALEYLLEAQARGPEPNSLALPLAFACFRVGDFTRAASYFCNARPKDLEEISVAFQLIQAMAAENDFRPHLSGCLRSKLDTFRKAFPEDLKKFMSGIENPESFPHVQQMEA